MTRTFRDLGVAENLTARLEELGIVEPATVQSLTFPIALEGADVIGLDRPESTTLAFALPLLQRLQPSGAGLQGLVIAPTRGRCVRVAKELTELAQPVRTALLAVYGGIPLGPQEQALDGARVDLVVGTPGRLLDHLQHGSLDLRDVKLVVIDEAAQLLDLGFTPDVDELVAHCPAERQTLLFAATLPDEVAALARRWLTHPVIVRADADHLRVASEAAQDFFLVHRLDKPRVLARILQAPDVRRAAVFVRTTRGVDRLVEELRSVGVDAIASPVVLDRSQPAASFDRFLGGESEVLVATEASARRIELRGVSHVINYDCPADETVYLHRIGRAARTAGTVITLVGFHEAERLHMIRTALGMAQEPLEQVFSTSGLLTERFDLPPTTPWDHLANPVPVAEPPAGKNMDTDTDTERGDGAGIPLLPHSGSGSDRPQAPRRRAARRRARRSVGARPVITDRGEGRHEPAAVTTPSEAPTEHEALRDRLLTDDPAARTAVPGPGARGAGQPTLTRRLRVEHLP